MFLLWLFIYVKKATWLERWGSLQNAWRHNLVNKQLQYTYCRLSHEAKTTTQWTTREHNKRKIFLQKLYRKLGRETSSRPLSVFFKKFNMS